MNVHEQTNEYLLGYSDGLEFVGEIIVSATKRGLTIDSTLEMINAIVFAIHESKEKVNQQQEFASLEDIIAYIAEGGK